MTRALVVGPSSDIGRAVAVDRTAAGHDVVLWGRDDDRLSVDQVDLTDHPGVRAALDRVLADGPLHTVVWAAGVFDWAPADQADAGTWQRLLDVDLPANGCPVEVELQPQRTP